MSSQKFTLSFSKTIEKKSLQPSVIRNDAPAEVKQKTEALQSIEENVLQTDSKEEETELVIPLVQDDRASIRRKLAEKLRERADKEQVAEVMEQSQSTQEQAKPLTLDEQAEAALLEESKKLLDGWSEQSTNDKMTISVATTEKESDMTADVGTESTLDDYDKVDVSAYGPALLRGMGWKKAEGIGGRTKRVVEIIDPTSKTFGLAGRKAVNQGGRGEGKQDPQEEELILANGSCVFIHSGRYRGTYGVVESLDEDHLLVKAAVSQNVVREVELNVRVVSAKEFKDSSRVINKDMYDKFKEEEARKKGLLKNTKDYKSDERNRKEPDAKKMYKEEVVKSEKDKVNDSHETKTLKIINKEKTEGEVKRTDKYETSGKPSLPSEDKTKGDYKEQSKMLKRDSDRYSEKHTSKSSGNKHYESDKYERHKEEVRTHKYSHYSQSSDLHTKPKDKRGPDEDRYSQVVKKAQRVQEKMPAIPWVRENLRVRLISKSYKGGRYHKEKVVVRSIETAESCVCTTEEGKVLSDVDPAWLETVIPKIHPQVVMIVNGKEKGQKGRILQLHREQEKASIQLLEDETVILKLHYDDICEYVRR